MNIGEKLNSSFRVYRIMPGKKRKKHYYNEWFDSFDAAHRYCKTAFSFYDGLFIVSPEKEHTKFAI